MYKLIKIIGKMFELLTETESSEYNTLFMVGFFGFGIENRFGIGYWWRFETNYP